MAVPSSILIGICSLILGWFIRFFYDLKVRPFIEKAHKQSTKKETEREEKEKAERESLQRSREKDRGLLIAIKEPLHELKSIMNAPDSYPPMTCNKLLLSIRGKAERIELSEFRSSQEKLLKFSNKRDSILSTAGFAEIMHIVTGKYDGLGPQDMLNEIETIIKDTLTPHS
jgi:hypothetical protein